MIIIGLGANLPHPEFGAPARTLEAALAALDRRGVRIDRRSRWYMSPPWPASLSGQPWYVNGAASLKTDLAPDQLLRLLHEVEWSFGRVRTERWAPRWIDLDLIAYHDMISESDGQHGVATLPHPRMDSRAFVLLPLRDVAPDWHHPISGRSVAQLIAETGPDGVEPLVETADNYLAGGAVGS